MNDKKIIQAITPETITITINTLAALDSLQGKFYVEQVEPRLGPHSESQVVEMATEALGKFVMRCPGGNASLIRMNSSAFIDGMRMIGMKEQAEFGIRLCEKLD